MFDWDITVNCFYAVYNGANIDEPTCERGEDCATDITNYSYRAVALDELYPANGDKTTEAGWNWSCAATDLSDPNYPIAPTALIKDIQEKGDSVYSDEYLDYSITLTPETIKKIKEINGSTGKQKENARKNFLDLVNSLENQGRDYLEDDMKVLYKSAFLDELGSSVVTTRPTTEQLKCNNMSKSGCVTSNMIEADTCINAYNLAKEKLNK